MNQSDKTVRGAVVHSAFRWIVVALLAIIAAGLWMRPADSLLPAALAQSQSMAGARGVFAFTGQIDNGRYGLFMLDVDQGTVWCYELDSVGGTRKLRLSAARSWIYDRYLQDFNCAQPDFRAVQELVAQQRATPAGKLPRAGEPEAGPDLSATPDRRGPGKN